MDDRLDKLRRFTRRVADRIGEKLKDVAQLGDDARKEPSDAFPRWEPTPAQARAGDAGKPTRATETEVLLTSDRSVLIGLTGLQLVLEPRDKPLLVNHWATWCEDCVEELSLLVQLRLKWKEQVDFVGVGWEGFQGDGPPESWVKAVEICSDTHGVDWPTLIYEGSASSLVEGLKLSADQIPQTLVLSVNGEQLYAHHGVLTDDGIAMIEAAFRECVGGDGAQ